MYRYNPKKSGNWKENPNGRKWRVVIDKDQKKFVVTYMQSKINKKFIVDGFENRTGCGFNDEDNIWYSFDSGFYNFHIVPDKEVKFEDGSGEYVSVWLEHRLVRIKDEVDKVIKGNEKLKTLMQDITVPSITANCAKNHRYFYVNTEETQYLMSFNRLWFAVRDNDTHICNNFGQAQFMCYPRKDGDINSFPNTGGRAKYEFELMYPNSAEDGISEGKGRHLVFNAPYDINCGAEKIAKCFAEFIGLCEELCKKDKDGTINLKDDHEFIKWCEKNKECKKDETCKDNENCKEKRKENEKIT